MLQKLVGGLRHIKVYGATVGVSQVFTASWTSSEGRWAYITCAAGSGWAASVTMTFQLQDSLDDSTFADVSGATFSLTTANAATSSGVRTMLIDMHRLRRYVRLALVQNVTGNCATSVLVLFSDVVNETAANAPGVVMASVAGDSDMQFRDPSYSGG